MKGQRTYWHLADSRRKPSEYDIGSTRLLYYTARGRFETDVPLGGWYAAHQQGSPLRAADWDGFRDPRETTYARYTELQSRKETFVSGLFDALDATGYDRALSPAWVDVLERVIAPMRYPCHGLQMLAAYVAHMAPGGRVAIAAGLQAADEMRRVHMLAYRMRQLQETHAGFGDDSRALWQDDPIWQPLRRLIEHLLVTFDWGEAFTALNLVAKPAIDELLVTQLARLAASQGDEILAKLFLSLADDAAWQREWSAALVDHALASDPANREHLERWIEAWRQPVTEAIGGFRPVWDELAARAPRPSFDEARDAALARVGLGARPRGSS